MYYRRKLLLALLAGLGGRSSSITYQKLLFLFCNQQAEPCYSFVPYKFGCFSFESYADRSALTKQGFLSESSDWLLKDGSDFAAQLSNQDQTGLESFLSEYRAADEAELLSLVYTKYPYYAINSEIAPQVLSAAKLDLVDKQRPKDESPTLFTIGYEGRSVDEYLNRLIQNNVQILCDVRKNPISRKYGFSKRQLAELTSKLGIGYVHFPELGIESVDRKDLNTKSDYQRLFAKYERTILPKQSTALESIKGYVESHKRVALTCYEADHEFCHRSRAAAALRSLLHNNEPLQHL